MCAAETTIDREADRLVSVMLTDVRVTAGFRAALFSVCGRTGSTMNEFLIQAAAEKLAADGYGFTGIFEPGDITSKAAPDPFAGDQGRTSITFNGAVVTKAEKAAFELHKPEGRTYADWAVALMREKVLANIRRAA